VTRCENGRARAKATRWLRAERRARWRRPFPSATVASLILGDHLGDRPDQFSSLEEFFEAHHKAATGDLYGVLT